VTGIGQAHRLTRNTTLKEQAVEILTCLPAKWPVTPFIFLPTWSFSDKHNLMRFNVLPGNRGFTTGAETTARTSPDKVAGKG
jgi:hypothetical protein